MIFGVFQNPRDVGFRFRYSPQRSGVPSGYQRGEEFHVGLPSLKAVGELYGRVLRFDPANSLASPLTLGGAIESVPAHRDVHEQVKLRTV